ncbi:MAG TPA: DUF6677 family protein [Gemmataceae bacterium]|nr:DUF6677 family protein [Gemmataceae bacterium]
MSNEPEPQPTSLIAGFLSFLVPGLGQIVQGRVTKGLMFLVLLLTLFHVGHAMGNYQNVYLPPPEPPPPGAPPLNLGQALYNSVVTQRLPFAGQVWIGVAAWPALLQYFDYMPAAAEERYPFLKTYMRAPRNEPGADPTEAAVNDFIRNSDKLPDVGLIYTIIAGVLNILVIYDAYAGPAFLPPKKKEAPSV